METSTPVTGKKVKLEVSQDDAGSLRENGEQFMAALIGQTLQPQSRLMFNDMIVAVAGTKPKGPIQVARQTAVKISITKKPIEVMCPDCGTRQTSSGPSCTSCGKTLPLVML